jgi:cytochrome P450
VKLLQGTYVQVATWPRHRNPKLWGDDAGVFNPDREFADDEVRRCDDINAIT